MTDEPHELREAEDAPAFLTHRDPDDETSYSPPPRGFAGLPYDRQPFAGDPSA